MSIPLPSFAFQPPGPDHRVSVFAAPSVATAQRASLGRGVAFVLLLTSVSLASVYVPLAMHGPDWVEGTAPAPLLAER